MKSDLNFERAVDKVETKQGEFLKQFNRLHKETEDLYHEVAMKIRMSDSAWEILYDILELGDGCLQRDICQISFIKKQTVGSAIRKLEKEGALYLKPGKGREMQIFLTEAGRRIVEERIEPIVRMENAVSEEMTQEESRELLRLTEKYVSYLRKKVKEFQIEIEKE